MLKSVPELVAEAAGAVDKISMEEALKIENAIVVDVRESVEISSKPVAGSISIPRGVLEMKITEHTKDPSAPICVHCATGGRAVLAAEQLMRFGFTNVKAVSCGIDDVLSAVDS